MGWVHLQRGAAQETLGRSLHRPTQPQQSTAALAEAASRPSYSQILATMDGHFVLPITVLSGVSYKSNLTFRFNFRFSFETLKHINV